MSCSSCASSLFSSSLLANKESVSIASSLSICTWVWCCCCDFCSDDTGGSSNGAGWLLSSATKSRPGGLELKYIISVCQAAKYSDSSHLIDSFSLQKLPSTKNNLVDLKWPRTYLTLTSSCSKAVLASLNPLPIFSFWVLRIFMSWGLSGLGSSDIFFKNSKVCFVSLLFASKGFCKSPFSDFNFSISVLFLFIFFVLLITAFEGLRTV